MRRTFFPILIIALATQASACFMGDGPHGHGDRDGPTTGADPAVTADLEIDWTVDGQKRATACSSFGVKRWLVRLSGPEIVKGEVGCGDGWDTGEAFYGLKPGIYAITVEARDAAGAPVASRQKRVALKADRWTIWTATFTFSASDFQARRSPGQLVLRWTINGTVDGSAAGASWDSCAEVGASTVAIDLDGVRKTFDCEANDQMQTLLSGLAAGPHAISLKLLDAKGRALTTEVKDRLTVGKQPAELTADFYFDAFFKRKGALAIKGDYIFKTRYERKSCADIGVSQQTIALKSQAGLPVEAKACTGLLNTTCFATDGKTKGTCQPSFKNQTIGDLPWGIYTLELRGLGAGDSTACWRGNDPKTGGAAVEILVGAGEENPVVTHDLKRITSAACR